MHDNLKLEAKEKVVQKMTRDGAIEEHLGEKTAERVSHRPEEVRFREGPLGSAVDQRKDPGIAESTQHKARTQKAFRKEAEEAAADAHTRTMDGIGPAETGSNDRNSPGPNDTTAVAETSKETIPENRIMEITDRVREAQVHKPDYERETTPAGAEGMAVSRARDRRYAQHYRAETAKSGQGRGTTGVRHTIIDAPADHDSKEPPLQSPRSGSGGGTGFHAQRSYVIEHGDHPHELPDARSIQKKKQKRLYEEQKKQGKTKLQFEQEVLADAKGNPIRRSGSGAGAVAVRNAVHAAETALSGAAHRKSSEADDENSAVGALRKTEQTGRRTISQTARLIRSRRNNPYAGVPPEGLPANGNAPASRLRFESMQTVSGRLQKARGGTASGTKAARKRRIKRSYAALFRMRRGGRMVSASLPGAMPVRMSLAIRMKRLATVFVRRHRAGIVAAVVAILLLVVFASGFGTFSSMVSTVTETVVESTYLGDDTDILAVEAAYSEREAQLQGQIDRMESAYVGYDEYRYQIDEITHDPYALTSYLSTKYGTYQLADVQSDLAELFAAQYTLSISDETEIRTRTVTQTVTDPMTGEESQIEVEETYEYRILNVVLTNQGLDAVVRSKMDADQLNQYGIYQASLGNRSYLFGDSIVVGNVAGGGVAYEVPPEALGSDRFARMLQEAEKYLGYPYVWGGSSPSTSFDCSGFVSWVINHSGNGWNYGRRTAEGLRNLCAYVSPQDAEPGDLVFFKGTYNTSGASHVGIYVGNGMMIHCGKPIQYSSIETNYWRQHFYCFGRLP